LAFVGPLPYECQSPSWNAAGSPLLVGMLHPARAVAVAVPVAARNLRRDDRGGVEPDGTDRDCVEGGSAGDTVGRFSRSGEVSCVSYGAWYVPRATGGRAGIDHDVPSSGPGRRIRGGLPGTGFR
jgi:hypothetical protein